MVGHCHPADELAALHRQIKDLKAREMELRKLLLHGQVGLQGKMHRAVLRRLQRRVFLKDRLPDAVLNDPRLWEDRTVTHVKTEPWPALRAIRPGDPVALVPEDRAAQTWGITQFEVIEGRDSARA